MNTGLKITAFAAAVAATFGTAYGVGQGVDPVTAEKKPASEHGGHTGEKEEPGGGGTDAGAGHADAVPGGLQISERGYTLDLKTSRVDADKREELRFAVVKDGAGKDGRGKNVTAYETEHDKELHLIVASRDLTTYRHLHPTRAADGTWSTPVELPEAGGYRVFADFKPEGAKEGLTLGADLAVAGKYEPKGLPEHNTKASVDGYEVSLDGELKPGKSADLTLNVAKNGKPVTDLQPYLGSYGHLVALRSGDLAYLHVHPTGEPGDGRTKPGPGVSFAATAPSPGSYRLFLDFKHEGKVRTAAFTVTAGSAGEAASEHDGASESGEHGH
ncbi:hypothetical protein GCM10009837_77460 [Streptomyces durmitorensis]|uniref:DUF748 domain-containing protein n=1 Tax=Streptomyces durmitorensis TaxID=319947 RepID=A0ABY4PVI6_9ACTN|nr:hypothetical protein [Streptomyces durmitorensis]UQT57842.1 hypothetical protein M4V62_23625 [Streptomyces durmitorensis]